MVLRKHPVIEATLPSGEVVHVPFPHGGAGASQTSIPAKIRRCIHCDYLYIPTHSRQKYADESHKAEHHNDIDGRAKRGRDALPV